MRHTGDKRVWSIQSLRQGSEQLGHPIPSESAWGKSVTKLLTIGEVLSRFVQCNREFPNHDRGEGDMRGLGL